MEKQLYCSRCAAEISDPAQPCSRCGHVMFHPQRQRYQRQVLISGVTTLLGYASGMVGLLLKLELVGVAGLIMGFIGGVWFMIALYLLLRTGV